MKYLIGAIILFFLLGVLLGWREIRKTEMPDLEDMEP